MFTYESMEQLCPGSNKKQVAWRDLIIFFTYFEIFFFTFNVTNAAGVGVVSCKEWVLAELTESVSPGRALGRGPLTEGVQRRHIPLIHGPRAGEEVAIGWPKHFRLTHTAERKQK